jgi:cystathionine beta-lyase/cystathionine gamma-synthase
LTSDEGRDRRDREAPKSAAGASSGDWHIDTRTARAGKSFDLRGGAPSATPIVPSSAFQQPDAESLAAVTQGARPGYVYGRYHNPTVEALEETVADLEGAERCLAYSSGMSAIAGAFAAVDPPRGAKIIANRDLYGTTIIWLEDAAARNDWQIIYVDLCDRPFATNTIRAEKPSMVYMETLSNPLVRVVDLGAIGPASRDAGAVLVVDATFTPPTLLRPIEHAATLVVHSATKYLGGHGDLVGGVLSGPASLIDKAHARRTLDGTIVDPFSAWLILRGLKTLPLRFKRQCANAREIAAHLSLHYAVERVHYPGLGHRDTPREKEVLQRLFPSGDYGAIVAFEVTDGGEDDARLLLDTFELWGTATTLGDLGSNALVPLMSSHRHLPPERRTYMGIADGLIRLSVGIEDIGDLIADLDAALGACRPLGASPPFEE